VNRGELVPEEIIFGLLSKRLEYGYDNGETGFILDGIPRTQIQAVSKKSLVIKFSTFSSLKLLFPTFSSGLGFYRSITQHPFYWH